MSLGHNATLFTERVSQAPISGNIDNPEGGLDALMQVNQLIDSCIFLNPHKFAGHGLWR